MWQTPRDPRYDPVCACACLGGVTTRSYCTSRVFYWQGKLATEFAALLKSMWSGQYSVVTLAKFKRELGAVFVDFRGHRQQDALQFFSCFADKLGEDVSRVRGDVPPVELPTEGDLHTVAMRRMEDWRKRSDNVVSNLFYGMEWNRTQCEGCGRTSTCFQPYLNLSAQVQPVGECVCVRLRGLTFARACSPAAVVPRQRRADGTDKVSAGDVPVGSCRGLALFPLRGFEGHTILRAMDHAGCGCGEGEPVPGRV